jgi:DNA (cytosine-5)-methyltransferase 1
VRLNGITMCSGIGAPECAAQLLGLDVRWLAAAEIEPFPAAVHEARFPGVPNVGDMTKVDWQSYRGLVDVVVAGTPCQAFSVAGLRGGLSDARGNLTLEFVRAVDAIDPLFTVWENVPGVLSSRDNAFGCFLAAICGDDEPLVPDGRWPNAGVVVGPTRSAAWRILDAQYFGVAQRRRRVFVVACPRGGPDPFAVLFEPEGVQRHPAPSREAREGVARGAASGAGGGGEPGGVTEFLPQSSRVYMPDGVAPALQAAGTRMGNQAPQVVAPVGATIHGTDGTSSVASFTEVASALRARIPSGVENSTTTGVLAPLAWGGNNTSGPIDVATAVNAHGGPHGRLDFESETFVTAFYPTQDPISSEGVTHALGTGSKGGCATVAVAQYFETPWDAQEKRIHDVRRGAAPTLSSRSNGGGTVDGWFSTGTAVRRLTPTECERLQGLPDGWTDIVHRGKPAADGPRYKAIGNSMAVPVLGFILRRLHAEAERHLGDMLS